MDRMEMFEAKNLIRYSYYVDKNVMEIIRHNSYVTLQSVCTKELKPTDILTFSWEEEDKKAEANDSLSTDTIARMALASDIITNLLNGGTAKPVTNINEIV